MGGSSAFRRWVGRASLRARRSSRKILAAAGATLVVTTTVVALPATPVAATGVNATTKTAAWDQSGSGVALIDGQLVTYTLNATRASSPDTTGVTISDTLPAGLDYVSSDGPGAIGSGTYDAGTRVVSWTNQTLTSSTLGWTIVARVNLAANANIANSFTAASGGNTDSASVTTNDVLNVVPNPDLPVACRALKVTLVLDASGSIEDAGAVGTVRTAARDFLTALSGTGSQANVVSFSTSADTLLATMTTINSTSLANGGALDNALDGYFTTGSFDGWTNWEDGLREALGLYDSNYTTAGGVTASQVPDLVVFITDGAPTTYIGGPTGTGSANIANSRNAAIDEANFIKSTVVSGAQNIKILGLGVGQISTQQQYLDNFLAISGNGLGQGQQATTVTTATFPTLDLLTSDFSGLSQALKDLVSSLCSNAVTITKQVQDPATGTYSVADGWEMEGNLTFAPVGQSYAWVSPGTAAPSNGRKGNTFSPAGQPNTVGSVVFQWTTTGVPTTQTFAFKENPTAGQNQNYSFDSVSCLNAGSPVTVTTVNGFFTVTVPYKAALNCTIKNKFNFNPAINVDKTANPTTILANGNTTYTYAVTNTGNVPLSNIQLTDNRFSNACLSTPQKAGGNQDAVLDLGEVWTYTCVRSLAQGTTNTATVTGQPAVGPTVQDTDDATVTVIAPAINVAKTANPNVIYAGNTVTYTFVVTNVGTTPGGAGKPPLSSITVSDPNCVAISAPVKSGGDDGDAILEGNEIWTYTCSKAVSADVTNTVTATGTPAVGPNVSDTDTAVVNVINPAINIEKTASAPTVHSGDSVTYTFVVTNTGDDPLSNIVVADNKCSPLSAAQKTGGDQDALLETGEVWTYTCARPISATDTNTATATGTDSKGGTVTDTSSVTVNVITPGISITKVVDKPTVLAGTTVVYTMTVKNTGNTTLQNVVVSDPQCAAPPVRTGGDTNANNMLETSETWTYTCSSVITVDTTNTVTVTAQDSLGGPKGSVTATATAVVDVISPAIDIAKVADPTIIRWGESTTYTMNVTNGPSTETITNVVVSDPLCTPVYVSGDDGDAALEEGETWVYTCTKALTVDTTNTATVTGKDQLGNTVDDSANAFVEVIDPNINVDKTAAPTMVRSGDSVTYTYVVTTTSSDPLSNITLTDDKLAAACLANPVKTGGNQDALLDAGEAWTYTCTTTLTADTTNVATVIGTDKTNRTVNDTDPATVDVIFPAIDVQKSASPTIIRSGNDVTYTYVVTNTGDTTLGLTLDDDKLDALPCLATPTNKANADQDASFEPGEIWTFQCTTAIVSDTTNVVTATGTAPVGPNVTDTASANVDVIAPAINVVKTASANTVHVGDSVTYTYAVTLGGDNTPLTSVTLGDDKCASVSSPIKTGGDSDDVLEAGEVWTYACSSPIDVDTTNIATATGTAPDNGTVTDTDTQTVVVLNPDIAVVKKVDGQDAVIVRTGTAVTYTYSVTNPGDTPLSVSLDDNKLPTLQCLVDHAGDADGDDKLDPGETWLYTCAGQVMTADVTNTVTATGVDPLGGAKGTVTDTDTADVDVIDPGIKVVKSTSTPIIREGETASYDYDVSLDGDTPLTNVTLVDDKCSSISAPNKTGGDSDDTLEAGEVWKYTCTTPLSEDTTNTATASGDDPNGDPVTDTDTAHVDIIEPAIEIKLLTSDCVNDAPFVHYAITTEGFTPGLATITIYRLNTNTVIDTLTDMPLSGDFVYPGAAVDAGGNGTDWPGWKLENGEWVLDDSDAFLRDGIRVVISVNPTAEASVDYPAADPACANPPLDLALDKSDDGITHVPGEAFDYTLTVQNVGGTDATEDAIVTDVLPPELQWVTTTVPTGCSDPQFDGQTLTCVVAAADLTALGAPVEIVAQVKALANTPAGTYTNKAWVSSDDDPICPVEQQPALAVALDESCPPPPCPDGEGSNNVDCEETPVDNTAAIEVVKDDDVPNGVDIEPGGSYKYTITVKNLGPQPVQHVRITDNVPSVLTLGSVSGSGWNCGATTGNKVDCTYGSQLAAGATANVLTVNVTLKASFVGDNVHNVAVGTADVVKPEGPFEDETVTDQDDQDTPVRSLDITLLTADCVKDAPFVNYSIDPVGFDPSGTATVTIYRKGTNQVIKTITGLPLTGRFLYPGAAVDADGNGIDWPGWKLEDGEWVLDDSDAFLRDGIRVVVSVNPTAEATVGYPAASPVCASPEDTLADMAIVKTASIEQVGAGGAFQWILQVTNNGPDPAFAVQVGDIVPSSLQVTGVASSQFNCSTSGQTVSCTKAAMAVGESGTITIDVSVPASAPSGTIENVGTVQSALPDPDLTNNSDDASVTVVAVLPPTTTLPPVILPPTGSNSTTRGLQIAALTVLVGGLVVLITRRRRDEAAPTQQG